MASSEVRDALSAHEVADVEQLIMRVRGDSGVSPIDEGSWSRVRDGHASAMVAVLRRDDDDRLVGYAQAESDGEVWVVEIMTDPTMKGLRTALFGEVVSALAIRGGRNLRFWSRDPSDREGLATTYGLIEERELLRLRLAIPLTASVRRHRSVATRSFRVGLDEETFVEVNNRAFFGHHEQGGWTTDNVVEREAEPWFDANDFLLYEEDAKLAAFCWTKVETGPPRTGEIYVIAVDPTEHGRGLGSAVLTAGLLHLESRRVDEISLYVDTESAPAIRLYDQFGFVVADRVRAFTGSLR